jgi:hypothetical protein
MSPPRPWPSCRPRRPGRRSPVAVASWAAAFLSLLTASPGCLVTSESDFPSPVQTRPFLRSSNALPSLTQLIVISAAQETQHFKVDVQSEDNGQPLRARLIANWPDTKGTLELIESADLSPATFSTVRTVTFDWDPRSPTVTTGEPLSPGCHPLTLIVTHQFNELTNQPARGEDADFLVWWVLVDDPKDSVGPETYRVIDCPSNFVLPKTVPTTAVTPPVPSPQGG